MNRKQKIVVSITGIFLVLMILVGLTYAYFLTKITGNTNPKSISVTTANLAIVYEDNSAEILGKDLILEPNSEKEIGTKTFTVTNKGNAKTSYVVVIDETKITNATDGTTTTFESNDFRYTLTCVRKNGKTCNGESIQSIFPIQGGFLVSNSISVNDVHSYVLTMWYIDTGIDQTNDMNKRLEARINITDITQMENPYSGNTNSLAYNIIENAKNQTNGTEMLTVPKTNVYEKSSFIENEGTHVATNQEFFSWTGVTYGDTLEEAKEGLNTLEVDNEDVVNCNIVKGKNIYSDDDFVNTSSKVIDCTDEGVPILVGSSEKTMSISTDDYGTSYYYRGNPIDNYVNFADMCWRIVRIQGDGSIKLILEDQNTTCNNANFNGNWKIGNKRFGYTLYKEGTVSTLDGTKTNTKDIVILDYLFGETNSGDSMATIFKNFQETKLSGYLDKLKIGDWCYNDNSYHFVDDKKVLIGSSRLLLDSMILRKQPTYEVLEQFVNKNGTLKCTGKKLSKYADNTTDMYVGTVTANEVIYAGANQSVNPDIYLINNFQRNNNYSFTTLTPYLSFMDDELIAYAIGVQTYTLTGSTLHDVSDEYEANRPAITLKSNISISGGDGTQKNPYAIQ